MSTNTESWAERLSGLASRLNVATDQVGKAVLGVERFLGEIQLGIYGVASVEHRPGRRLAYARVSDRYRICVEHDEAGPDLPEGMLAIERTPWAELARSEKLESAVHLDSLIGNLLSRAEALDAAARAIEWVNLPAWLPIAKEG
jgi:hypothetical protein